MIFPMTALFWQDSVGLIARIWDYLNKSFTFGRITVSISSVAVGLLVLTVTILVARYASAFIEGRMARRHHIDPGL